MTKRWFKSSTKQFAHITLQYTYLKEFNFFHPTSWGGGAMDPLPPPPKWRPWPATFLKSPIYICLAIMLFVVAKQ